MSEAVATADRTPALDVSHLSSGYSDSIVINNVSLTIGRAEIFALLGKNGMGKTTLARTLLGFLPPRSGTIIVGGKDMTGSTPDVMARAGIAHAPQEKAIFRAVMSGFRHRWLGLSAVTPASQHR